MVAATLDQTFDVGIVGGGPAGLTAALWLGRYLRSVVLVDSGDPRNWETRSINGFTGRPGIRPAELRGETRDECRTYGVELVDGFVTRIHRVGEECFRLEFDPMPVTKADEDRRGPGTPRSPDDNAPRPVTRAVTVRRLILAFGLKDEWPKLPGLRQVYGSTAHVCPDCDGYETRGKKVVVIASGKRAAAMALRLTTWTTDIVICTNGEPADLDAELCAKLDALGIPVLTPSIVCVHPEQERIHSIELEGGMLLDCDHIFFSLSQRPADDLGAQLGCRRTRTGHIVIDEHNHTSVRHVYAAGDITPGPQLAISAAAGGAIAALAVHHSLVPEERRAD
jgi:thioredoxin reductase